MKVMMNRDPKRVRITRKQLDKRADLELTDDAVSKRATLCDTPSTSSLSSHEAAPKLLVSSGGDEDSEVRESVTKKPRGYEHKPLHRLLEEIPLESEAVTKAAELNSIRDKRVHTEVCENEDAAKIISSKCVLMPHKARYVLRGFEEDVKGEDVFASTTMNASVRMLLS